MNWSVFDYAGNTAIAWTAYLVSLAVLIAVIGVCAILLFRRKWLWAAFPVPLLVLHALFIPVAGIPHGSGAFFTGFSAGIIEILELHQGGVVLFAHRKLSPKFAGKTGRLLIKKAAEAVLKNGGSRSAKDPAAGIEHICLTLALLSSRNISAGNGGQC